MNAPPGGWWSFENVYIEADSVVLHVQMFWISAKLGLFYSFYIMKFKVHLNIKYCFLC